jgi:hypothetical protein
MSYLEDMPSDSSGDQHGNDPFAGYEISPVSAMLNAVMRYNAIGEQGFVKDPKKVWNYETCEDPRLHAWSHGNRIAIELMPSNGRNPTYLDIGYFSVVQKQVVMIPELLTTEEAQLLLPDANLTRWMAITDFEMKTGTAKRYDYENPEVRDLHRSHDEFLKQDGQLYSLVQQYSDRSVYLDGPSYDVDEHTEAVVNVVRSETDKCYRMGVLLTGAIESTRGVSRRLATPFAIPIARSQTNSFDDELEYVPACEAFGVDDIEDVIELANDVTRLEVTMKAYENIKLNTEKVAVEISRVLPRMI